MKAKRTGISLFKKKKQKKNCSRLQVAMKRINENVESTKMKGMIRNVLRISKAVTWRCSGKGVLKNFAKFTGKHLCQSLIFNKVAVH